MHCSLLVTAPMFGYKNTTEQLPVHGVEQAIYLPDKAPMTVTDLARKGHFGFSTLHHGTGLAQSVADI